MSVFSKKRGANLLKKVIAPFILSSSLFSCAPQITNATIHTWKVEHNYNYSHVVCGGDQTYYSCRICHGRLKSPEVKPTPEHDHICDLVLKYDDATRHLTIKGTGELNGWVFNNLDIRKDVKEISVKKGITACAGFTFESMSELEKIDLSHVKVIGNTLFRRCESLKTVIFSDDLEKANFSRMFNNCKNLEHVVLPKNIKEIEGSFDYMFQNCEKLTGVENFPTIPKEIKSMVCTFENCPKLKPMKLEIEDGGKLFLDRTFVGCKDLASIYIDKEKVSLRDSVENGGCFVDCGVVSLKELQDYKDKQYC